MKQLLLAMVLIFSMALISYGKTGNKKTSLIKDLTTAMRSSQNLSTSDYGSFTRTSFIFNEKVVSAYFDAENNDLIGFGIPVQTSDLPSGSMDAIQKKYSQYTFEEAIMFINETGVFKWYISMTRTKKPTIVLVINEKGKVSYYTKK